MHRMETNEEWSQFGKNAFNKCIQWLRIFLLRSFDKQLLQTSQLFGYWMFVQLLTSWYRNSVKQWCMKSSAFHAFVTNLQWTEKHLKLYRLTAVLCRELMWLGRFVLFQSWKWVLKGTAHSTFLDKLPQGTQPVIKRSFFCRFSLRLLARWKSLWRCNASKKEQNKAWTHPPSLGSHRSVLHPLPTCQSTVSITPWDARQMAGEQPGSCLWKFDKNYLVHNLVVLSQPWRKTCLSMPSA